MQTLKGVVSVKSTDRKQLPPLRAKSLHTLPSVSGSVSSKPLPSISKFDNKEPSSSNDESRENIANEQSVIQSSNELKRSVETLDGTVIYTSAQPTPQAALFQTSASATPTPKPDALEQHRLAVINLHKEVECSAFSCKQQTMEELLEKYQNLLKPIRDLEQNWSVDLSNELSEALVSLNSQMISFGQSDEKIIDFSKAAMIIQGSANVYSKKVDYLYKTVYEMKEWMEKLWEVEKKSKSNRTKIQGTDAEVELNDVDEDDDLDLSICEDDRIQLTESDELVSNGAVVLPPKPLMLNSNFNLKIPLKSLSGDVIGYMNDFHINYLDAGSLSDSHIPSAGTRGSAEEPDVAAEEDAALEGAAACVEDSIDVDNGAGDITLDQVAEPAPEVTPVCVEKQTVTRKLRPRIANLQTDPPLVEAVDPWSEILDPYTVVTHRPSKALKPGNHRVLPPSLRKGRKRVRNGDKPNGKNLDDVATFCNKEYRNSLVNTGANTLLYPEFKVLFAEILQKRQNDLLAIKRQSRCSGGYEEEASVGEGADHQDDGCGNESDGEQDDDLIPFSRLHDSGLPHQVHRQDDELPEGYSDLLARALQKECDDLATHSDHLSEIDRRVKVWEKNIRGAIETAETRPAFDMLYYSNCIFDSFVQDATIPMEKILEGKPKFEAFRTFVSALILANHGNIEINDIEDHVELSLLNKTTLSDVIASDTTNGKSGAKAT